LDFSLDGTIHDPVHRWVKPKDLLMILDILEWLQIKLILIVSTLPNLSHGRLRHHGIRGAKNGYSRSYCARNLLETTQDTLNHDTVDADAVPGISTDIAYNQEHNSFFLRPLDTEFGNFFYGQKDLDGRVEMSWAGEKVAKHNHKIG
jgi:hypothetical protein